MRGETNVRSKYKEAHPLRQPLRELVDMQVRRRSHVRSAFEEQVRELHISAALVQGLECSVHIMLDIA